MNCATKRIVLYSALPILQPNCKYEIDVSSNFVLYNINVNWRPRGGLHMYCPLEKCPTLIPSIIIF